MENQIDFGHYEPSLVRFLCLTTYLMENQIGSGQL